MVCRFLRAFQKVASIIALMKRISSFRKMRDFQGNKIDICVHRLRNLLGRIAIMIYIAQYLVRIEQDFGGYDVRLRREDEDHSAAGSGGELSKDAGGLQRTVIHR